MVIKYFMKWVEADAVSINEKSAQKFILIPSFIALEFSESVSYNGTQFSGNAFTNLGTELRIEHRFASVGHPESNGQVEAANKEILHGLHTRVASLGGSWVDELNSVSRAYWVTPCHFTGETHFLPMEAILPMEVALPTMST